MESIHQRLKKYRHQSGLTLQEVSSRTGIPASTYKEWENGRQIRGEPYMILAELFQVSVVELISGQKGSSSTMLAKLDKVVEDIEVLKRDLVALI